MWFLHYHYHNNDLLATARRRQLLLMITILVHAGFSEIRTTIPGRDKGPASAGADQPHKRLREELTSHDYCEGKLLTHEKKSINIGLYFAFIFVGNLLVITHLVRFIFLFINETSSLPTGVSYFDDLIIFMKKFF